VTTGKTDGTITPDEDIIVSGDKIKILLEDDVALGVFFVDVSDAETRLTRKLAENMPKKLVFRLPSRTPARIPSR
jgi:hypothetical protein